MHAQGQIRDFIPGTLWALAETQEMLYSRPMDSVIFQAMAVELNTKLANSRLDKVQQPGWIYNIQTS